MNDIITTVCIPTCDRPESLISALTGLIQNLKSYARSPRILVIDDSEDIQKALQSREICTSFINTYSGTIEYLDRKDREKLAIHLAQEKGLDEETIKFGLCGDKRSGITLGSSHNTILLKTRGEKILIADDDVTYAFFAPKKTSDSFFSIENPLDYYFLNRKDEIPNTIMAQTNIDFLSIHEKNLGKTSLEILKKATPDYIQECKVVDTYMGSIGDSTMASHFPLLLLPQVQEKINIFSKEEYEVFKKTTKIAQVSPSLCLYQGPMSISMVLGIDNRQSVPAFLPLGRGHDLVFGVTRNKAFPLCISGYLPVLVGHERPQKEARIASYNPVLETTKMCRVLASLINEIADVDIDPENNLNRIAQKFISLAEQPTNLFTIYMEEQCRKITRETANFVDTILQMNVGVSLPWIQDIEIMRDTLRNPDSTLFLSDITREPNQEKMVILQKWILLYGQLLQTWSKLL